MSFEIDPKSLSLQGAAGMQLVKIIRNLKKAVDSDISRVEGEISDGAFIVSLIRDTETNTFRLDKTKGEIIANKDKFCYINNKAYNNCKLYVIDIDANNKLHALSINSEESILYEFTASSNDDYMTISKEIPIPKILVFELDESTTEISFPLGGPETLSDLIAAVEEYYYPIILVNQSDLDNSNFELLYVVSGGLDYGDYPMVFATNPYSQKCLAIINMDGTMLGMWLPRYGAFPLTVTDATNLSGTVEASFDELKEQFNRGIPLYANYVQFHKFVQLNVAVLSKAQIAAFESVPFIATNPSTSQPGLCVVNISKSGNDTVFTTTFI